MIVLKLIIKELSDKYNLPIFVTEIVVKFTNNPAELDINCINAVHALKDFYKNAGGF